MSMDTRKLIVATLAFAISSFGGFAWTTSESCLAQQVRRGHEPVYRIPLRPQPSHPQSSQPQPTRPLTTQQVEGHRSATVQPRGQQGVQANPVSRISSVNSSNGNYFPQDGGGVPNAMRGGIAPVGYSAPLLNEAMGRVEGSEDSHPLDPALTLARRGLDRIRTDIRDYTCYMVKRERVNGRLTQKETMFVKIRNRRHVENGNAIPFSIYMRFVAPESTKGREVIWVENRNNNRLVAHDVGLKGFIRANLDPDGRMAMSGNRYPVYEAGIENLVVKLIEVAERDRAAGDCKVEFFRGATVQDRTCTVIRVTHPEKREPYDFYQAEVFIDDELQVPIRYVAYSWPERGGSKRIEEEYTYLNVKVNVGLKDSDFNPDNPDYDYP